MALGRANPEHVERIETVLREDGDFLSMAAICQVSGLAPGDVIPPIDYMYARQQITKRFALGDTAIIVDVTEVLIPEMGFSKPLTRLLKGIGVNRKNWAEVQDSYGLFRGWSDETLQPVTPLPLLEIDP